MDEWTENQNTIQRSYKSIGGGRGNNRKSGFLPGMFTGILIAVIAVGIFFALRGGGSKKESTLSPEGDSVLNEETLSKISTLEDYLDEYYYKSSELTEEEKKNGLYRGLMESTGDIFTCYFTPEEYKNLKEQTTGIYYGIGAYVSRDVETGFCVITGVIKNSPAETYGLKEGDIIYKINGEDMTGKQLDEVVALVRGDKGTWAKLTVLRDGEEMELEILRDKVDSPTVDSKMLENEIGYLQITEFDTVTVDQFTENLESLKAQGMKGLIIDLRGNPGGNVTTVCEVAEQILPKGLIFYMEYKDGKRVDYTCKGADFDLPLVVLVNGYSASASEILAGAIKDAGIGKLVGKKTYGKGIVQTVLPLDDGSAVKITVANYYTRNGNDIHLKGIEPDVEVDLDADAYLDDGTDTQLDKAVEVMLEEMGSAQ